MPLIAHSLACLAKPRTKKLMIGGDRPTNLAVTFHTVQSTGDTVTGPCRISLFTLQPDVIKIT